jgi:hypothetical protein
MIRLLLFIALLMPVTLQQEDPNANITWPLPVVVLRGTETITGTANLPKMTGYFIEYRPLTDDLTATPDAEWLPAVPLSDESVVNGSLGTWDTSALPDGLYELRMTVEVTEGLPVYVVVDPLRVENTRTSPIATPPSPDILPTVPAATPTDPPAPTPFDPTPRVEATVDANIRGGDSVDYDVIGALLTGETAPVVGLSSTGSGWYVIELPNGRRGWISPTVVNLSGDIRDVPRIAPPAPPTPTPVPATATPVTNVNLVAGIVRLDPPQPTCNQTFNIFIDIANFGSTASPGGSINVIDFVGGNSTSTVGSFPPIQPGQTINVGPIPLTVSFNLQEEHTLRLIIDPNNQIAETNENDNTQEVRYILQPGRC